MEFDEDPHTLWEEDGCWYTDYPPPPGFDGRERGQYGDRGYRRTLTPAEQAVVDADEAADRAADRAEAERLRDAYFGFDEADSPDGADPDEEAEPSEAAAEEADAAQAEPAEFTDA